MLHNEARKLILEAYDKGVTSSKDQYGDRLPRDNSILESGTAWCFRFTGSGGADISGICANSLKLHAQ